MTAIFSASTRRWLHRLAFWCGILTITAFAVVAGLILRRYAWDQTEPFRYTIDIDNAFRQGTMTIQSGYLDRYDLEETREQPAYLGLDYAPGRLAIARLWAGWVRTQVDNWDGDPHHLTPWRQQFYARARTEGRQYQLVRPMLMINIAGELLSSTAMFLLVQRYTARHRPARGVVLGLIASLFFWFDPALISNAHCWPQWDSWVLPFFLWAVLLGSWNFWFCSGVVIATGAMFKGQLLFGAPLLILWPLFQWRLPAVGRWISGLITATAAITAVWVLKVPGENPTGDQFVPGHLNPQAIKWTIDLILIFISISVLFWKYQTRRINLAWVTMILLVVQLMVTVGISAHVAQTMWIVLAAISVFGFWYYRGWVRHARLPLVVLGIAILLIYPLHQLAPSLLGKIICAVLALSLLLAVTRRRAIFFVASAWVAGAILLCIPVFGDSKGWFDLGIAYGTHHYEKMASDENNNLAELLKDTWGWNDLTAPVGTLVSGKSIDQIVRFFSRHEPLVPADDVILQLKYLLFSAWVFALILSSIGAAVNDRNRSPRFLAAISAPWIVFFAVMAQMHQRYLLWGASLSSATAALSPGYAALHLFLSFVSWTQELAAMAHNHNVETNNRLQLLQTPLLRFIDQWHPGIAWAVLLTAAIYLYTAATWKTREPSSSSSLQATK